MRSPVAKALDASLFVDGDTLGALSELPCAGRRIAYLARCPTKPDSGVFRKVLSQCVAWQRLGARPELFLLVSTQDTGRLPPMGVPVHVRTYGNPVSLAFEFALAVRDILGLHPALVYARYDHYHPAFELLARSTPLVLEINTDDRVEYSLGSRHRRIYNRITRKRMLGLAAGFVFVTSELAGSASFPARTPRGVVGNSIDLACIEPVAPVHNKAPVVGMVGSLTQPWQGVDLVVAAARLRPGWRFEIAGHHQPLDFPPNVHLLGVLPHSQLGATFAHWDVGIGPMALHRTGLHESSSLKVLEYLAYGLPVVLSAPMDLPKGALDYVRLVEGPVSGVALVAAVEQLLVATCGTRVPREQIHGIDAAVRERSRLEFLATVTR